MDQSCGGNIAADDGEQVKSRGQSPSPTCAETWSGPVALGFLLPRT